MPTTPSRSALSISRFEASIQACRDIDVEAWSSISFHDSEYPIIDEKSSPFSSPVSPAIRTAQRQINVNHNKCRYQRDRYYTYGTAGWRFIFAITMVLLVAGCALVGVAVWEMGRWRTAAAAAGA